MRPAIVRMASSSIPRVVTAGVPMRMPLGTKGLAVSKGIVFLLTVIPTWSSACFGVLSRSGPRRFDIDQHQVVVGPAGDDAVPRSASALAKALALATTCAGRP